MDLNDLKIDPEFEEKIPPLTEDEFSLLEQNIVADGEVLDPLIVWNNTILDGHNRYRILKKHPEIPFKTYPKDFSDKYEAIAWICNNQLGRRNLTPEQRRYLIGKRYEAEKASHEGHYTERDAETGQFTVSLSGEDLRLPERTSEKIAAETNTSRSFVENAERFAKGVDAAEAAVPGIRTEILSGSLKAKRDDVAAIARAAPEDRAELAKQLRQPKAKPEKTEEPEEIDDGDFEEQQSEVDDTSVRIPKKSEILALAESMNHSEGQAIGTVEDMIYEMNSAMQDMIFRWNFCKEAYAGPVRSRDGKRQIKDLAAEGIEYLKEIRKGKLWKGDTDENK